MVAKAGAIKTLSLAKEQAGSFLPLWLVGHAR
jgi:hypothetical protein